MCRRLDGNLSWSWWTIFTPLWIWKGIASKVYRIPGLISIWILKGIPSKVYRIPGLISSWKLKGIPSKVYRIPGLISIWMEGNTK